MTGVSLSPLLAGETEFSRKAAVEAADLSVGKPRLRPEAACSCRRHRIKAGVCFCPPRRKQGARSSRGARQAFMSGDEQGHVLGT